MKQQMFCLVGIVFLAAWIGSCSNDKTTVARSTADAWLKIVDSGNYAQSWNESASLMKTAVAKEQWEQILNVNRAPLGSLVSRKLTSVEYKEYLPGAPAGQYVLLQYQSTFEHKSGVIETAAPTLDKDGNVEDLVVLHQSKCTCLISRKTLLKVLIVKSEKLLHACGIGW